MIVILWKNNLTYHVIKPLASASNFICPHELNHCYFCDYGSNFNLIKVSE